MKRLLTAALALGIATSAHALVVTQGSAPDDGSTTFYQENQQFVGDPLIDANGITIGQVVGITADTDNDRRILVKFNDAMFDGYSGWIFTLDPKWKSGGSLELGETREELKAILDTVAATQPAAIKPAPDATKD